MSPATKRGIIDKASNHSAEQTLENLKNILQSKGVTLFALVDHSGEATKRGNSLRVHSLRELCLAQVIGDMRCSAE